MHNSGKAEILKIQKYFKVSYLNANDFIKKLKF